MLLSPIMSRIARKLTVAFLLLAVPLPALPADKPPPDPQARIQELIAQLDGSTVGKGRQARHAMKELVKIGKPAVPALIQATKHKSEWVRSWAAGALGNIHDPRAVPALLPLLEDPSFRVRAVAVWHAGGFAKSDPRVAPAVARRITDPDPMVRGWVVRAISEDRVPGRRTPVVIGVLEEALKTPDGDIRGQAFILLATLRGRDLAGEVKRTLAEETDPLVRSAAYNSVGRSLPADEQAAAWFLAALDEQTVPVTYDAVRGLEWVLKEGRTRLTPETAQSVMTALETALPGLLVHDSAVLRAQAVGLLAAIKKEDSLEQVLNAFKDPAPEVRIAGLQSIPKTGVKAKKSVVRAIVEALADQETDVRATAWSTLRSLIPGVSKLEFNPAAPPDKRTAQLTTIQSKLFPNP